MATVNISSVAGADLTWETSSFTWASNSYTWSTSKAGVAYTAGVTEDTVTLSDITKKTPTKKSLETLNLVEVGKKSPTKKNLETFALTELGKRNPTKNNLETFALVDLLKKSPTKKNLETLHLVDVYSDVVSFIRILAESFATTDGNKLIKGFTKKNLEALNAVDSYAYIVDFHKTLTETLAFVELGKRNPVKKNLETFHAVDSYSDIVAFHKTLTDVINFVELLKKNQTHKLNDAVDISDLLKKDAEKVFLDSFAFAEISNYFDPAKNSIYTQDLGAGEYYITGIPKIYRFFQDINYTSVPIGSCSVTFQCKGTRQPILPSLTNGTASWLVNPTISASYQTFAYSVDITVQNIALGKIGIVEDGYFYIKDILIENGTGTGNLFGIGKNSKEYLNLAEVNQKIVSKINYEMLDINDAFNAIRIILKNIYENANFVDSLTKSMLNKKIETLTFDELMSFGGIFSRIIQEVIFIVENNKNNLTKLNKENIQTIENYSKVTSFGRNFAETLHLVDKLSNALQYHLYENVGVSELYVDYISFILRAMETIHVAEKLASSFTLNKKETAHISETSARNYNKKHIENVAISELNKKDIAGLKKENVILLEQAGRSASILKKDTFGVADDETNAIGKNALETLKVAESYVDYIGFMLKILEHVIFTETPQKAVTLPKTETFSITDKIKKNPNKIPHESLHVTDGDAIERTVDYHKTIEEVIHLVDICAKHFSITKEEAVSIMTDILRRANATISDIVIATGDMTLDEFSALSTPAGYENFKEFISGDLDYKDALIKIIMEAGITSSRPYISEWKLNVDVPDVPDRGTATINAGTTTRVYFNRKFYLEPPEVSVTLKGGTVIATPRIVGEITLTYFDVELINNGNQVAGTISWAAVGY